MKQFILIVFLIHAGLSSAQDRFFYLGQPYIYKDSVLLDQSRLNLIYRHEFRVDTSASPMWSNVKMQVGRMVVKQTDLHVYLRIYGVKSRRRLPASCRIESRRS